MVETDDDDAKDQAPESNLRNCTLRENNVKEQVEGLSWPPILVTR